ncbi:MAG: class I SAM-dependent methyltransferase [Ignavibacteriae bacterium]|nr:class I SAM-dependent methyltransferase [Ignavibacteriota bacterium]
MKAISNRQFFDVTSEFYDEMIDFNSSLQRKRIAFKKVLPTNIKTVADLGCGSGIDSITLSELGFRVTAFDISKGMIEKAKLNANANKQTISFNNYSADKRPSSFNNKFDFICSLGNTFANLNKKQLKKSIERIYDLLSKNGIFLIHIINYEKILLERNRILNITNKKGNYYIRFYDFEKNHINFNILRFNYSTLQERKLVATRLYPHLVKDFRKILKQKKFNNLKFYGSIDKENFDSELSQDLFIYGSK